MKPTVPDLAQTVQGRQRYSRATLPSQTTQTTQTAQNSFLLNPRTKKLRNERLKKIITGHLPFELGVTSNPVFDFW